MRSGTHVFPDDLLQGVAQNLPGENFDILLDVAGLRSREAHDDLEELFAVLLGFRNSKGSEAFQISTNTVLLLDSETYTNERLEQVDGVNACDEALILAFPANAANANAVWGPLFRGHGLEISIDGASSLSPGELHKPALGHLLVLIPAFGHAIQVAIKLQDGLGRVDGVGVESLSLAEATGLLQGGGADKSRVGGAWRRSPVLRDAVGHRHASGPAIIRNGDEGGTPGRCQGRWGTDRGLGGGRHGGVVRRASSR